MAKEEAAETPELSDSERIVLLENRVAFHRILVVVLGALTVILLSSVITGVIVLNAQISRIEVPETGEETAGAPVSSSQLGKDQLSLKKEQEALAKRLAEIETALAAQGTIENIEQVRAMAQILRDQENAYRTVMLSLRAGMRDLSRMVPGSRVWLEEYEERMNRSITGSREREGRLQGFLAPPEQDDGAADGTP